MSVSKDYGDNTDFIYHPNISNLGEYSARNNYDKSFRTNLIVIRVIEELGTEASDIWSQISIIEIPFDTIEGWYISEYDGIERIKENHRSWG